ncbi:MAG: restriction endonuclease [Synergistaceae bacterium]|nr:restriction endonuclease [Synergistaceae bacterium]
MAVPKYDDFFISILTFLSDGLEHHTKEIRDYCADSFELSEEDRKAIIPSGANMLADRVSWSRFHLKSAGLIESPRRGVYHITQSGREALEQGVTLEYIQELQIKNGETISDSLQDESPARETQSPQEMIDYAMEQLKSELVDALLTEVIRMDEYDFEQLVVDLLLKMGYGKPEENKNALTKKSGDGGIDGIVRADRFGFDAVYTQAKKWKGDSHVHSPEIQKFLGAMVAQGATKGLFITTAQFSKGALDFSRKNPGHKIVLVDGKQLAELMIEYGLGVTTIKTYGIKRIDSDYFNKDE